MAEAVSNDLYNAVLNRKNITWTPDTAAEKDIKNAMEEAMDYLRSFAGSPTRSFDSGEKRNLFIMCALYFLENKRAEFRVDYKEELIDLRLGECFGCGKEESSV